MSSSLQFIGAAMGNLVRVGQSDVITDTAFSRLKVPPTLLPHNGQHLPRLLVKSN